MAAFVQSVGLTVFVVTIASFVAALLMRVPRLAALVVADDTSRLPALDGLRAVLALAVFSHHALYTQYYIQHPGQWFLPRTAIDSFLSNGAVEVFFMITAFLFWSRMTDPRKPPLGARTLYAQRFRRLAPAFCASMALVFIFDAVRSGFSVHESIPLLALHTTQQLAFGFFADVRYAWNGLTNAGLPNAGVTWSLAYEVAFYAFLPLVAIVPAVRRVWLAPLLLLAVGIAMRLTANSPFPVIGFIPGIIAAELMLRERPRKWLASNAHYLVAGGTVALLAYAVFFPGAILSVGARPSLADVPAWFSLSAIFAGVLSLGAPHVLTLRPLRFLGTISYSVYLFHGFVLFVIVQGLNAVVPIANLAQPLYVGLVALCAVLVVPFATLTYALFEHPFLRQHAQRSRPAAVLTSERASA